MNKIRVLIVEDHLAMVEGYKSILNLSLINYEFEFIVATSLNETERNLKLIKNLDLVLLDISLKKVDEENANSGQEAGMLIRSLHPQAKIIIITSHIEKLTLYSLNKRLNPEGFLIKSDFSPSEFADCIRDVINSKIVYSKTFQQCIHELNEQKDYLDTINRQLISLLNDGIKTKNLPQYLNLSISAIDKRKVVIKDAFGVQKGSDEDIIREAKRRGFV